jgi:hypothetical protein
VAAVLVFPTLGYALDLDQHRFGLSAGTAVSDASSVVAVAPSYGREADDYAVVVELTRTLMIIPIRLAPTVVVNRCRAVSGADDEERRLHAAGLVPWFLVAFRSRPGTTRPAGSRPHSGSSCTRWRPCRSRRRSPPSACRRTSEGSAGPG